MQGFVKHVDDSSAALLLANPEVAPWERRAGRVGLGFAGDSADRPPRERERERGREVRGDARRRSRSRSRGRDIVLARTCPSFSRGCLRLEMGEVRDEIATEGSHTVALLSKAEHDAAKLLPSEMICLHLYQSRSILVKI